MIMQDKLEKERNDAKNNVEEYVYDMRDKLHGMLEKFVSESVSKRSVCDNIRWTFRVAYNCTTDKIPYCVIIFMLLGP